MKVNAWTVNEENDVIRLIEIGVDGLITDSPDEVKKIIDKHYSK